MHLTCLNACCIRHASSSVSSGLRYLLFYKEKVNVVTATKSTAFKYCQIASFYISSSLYVKCSNYVFQPYAGEGGNRQINLMKANNNQLESQQKKKLLLKTWLQIQKTKQHHHPSRQKTRCISCCLSTLVQI